MYLLDWHLINSWDWQFTVVLLGTLGNMDSPRVFSVKHDFRINGCFITNSQCSEKSCQSPIWGFPQIRAAPKIISGWWFEPLWKIWVRQLGWLFPIYGKIKLMFQTTNQIYFDRIFPYINHPAMGYQTGYQQFFGDPQKLAPEKSVGWEIGPTEIRGIGVNMGSHSGVPLYPIGSVCMPYMVCHLPSIYPKC